MSVAEIAQATAKEIRQRLMRPPNAIPDKGINLRPNRIPQWAPRPELPKSAAIVTIKAKRPPKPVDRVSFAAIVRAVCYHFHTNLVELMGRCRKQEVVLPRHIIIHLARKHTQLSTPDIGRRLNRDHTSIIHGSDSMKKALLTDTDLQEVIATIEAGILAGYYG